MLNMGPKPHPNGQNGDTVPARRAFDQVIWAFSNGTFYRAIRARDGKRDGTNSPTVAGTVRVLQLENRNLWSAGGANVQEKGANSRVYVEWPANRVEEASVVGTNAVRDDRWT